jgi:hypothetical protein
MTLDGGVQSLSVWQSQAATSSASSASAARSVTRSTASLTAARCSARSALRGPSAGGRRPAGHYTKRQAEDWLRDVLDEARKGTLAGLVRTGVTVDEAAAEFLRYLEHDRARKPATIRGYRCLIHGHISPAFGDIRIEDVTPAMVEAWSATLSGTPASRRKIIVTTHGIFQGPARPTACPRIRSPTSRSRRCAAAATSRSTLPRRSGHWSALPTPSRTLRST